MARRDLFGPLALALTSILLALTVGEGFVRIVGYSSPRFRGMARLASRDSRLVLDCYPSNPRQYFDIDLRDRAMRARYFSLAPHRYDRVARTTPFAIESRYSPAGFRGENPGPKRPGVRRIVVFGDSFTEGLGVRPADAYPLVLEALLNAQEAGHWQVLNYGRRHTDFPELLDLFEEALAHDPDLVIYGMSLNDPVQSETLQAQLDSVYEWIMARRRVAAGPPRGRLESRLLELLADRIALFRIGRQTSRWYHDLYGEPNREGWRRTQDYWKSMNARAQDRGSRFLLVSWPLLVGLEGSYPFRDVSETIRGACLANGIAHHDLLPALQGRRSESLWVHPVDMHPNEIAHRLAAESLAPVVRRLN